MAKAEDTKAEYRRSVDARAERLDAFRQCVPIRNVVSQLCELAGDLTAGGLRHGNFLNLHLSLSREGYLDVARVGPKMAATFPHCWGPPPYVCFLEAMETGQTPEAELDSNAQQASDFSSELNDVARALLPWDVGLTLWRMFARRGVLKGGVLPLAVVVDACFELADACESPAPALKPTHSARTAAASPRQARIIALLPSRRQAAAYRRRCAYSLAQALRARGAGRRHRAATTVWSCKSE